MRFWSSGWGFRILKDLERGFGRILGLGLSRMLKGSWTGDLESEQDVEKCLFLKKKFKNLKILKWESLKEELNKFDIVINATSLGLKDGQEFDFDF